MTAPRTDARTPAAVDRTLSRTERALYDMLTVGFGEIEDPLALAQQLMAVREKLRAVLAEVQEELDCAVSEALEQETYTAVEQALVMKRSTVQDHANRGRAIRSRYAGSRTQ